MSDKQEDKQESRPLILDLSRLHPEEREAVQGIIKSNTNAHKGLTKSMLSGVVALTFICGQTFGLMMGSCGTVSKKQAILYGHGEEVDGEFRWKNHPEHEPRKKDEEKKVEFPAGK